MGRDTGKVDDGVCLSTSLTDFLMLPELPQREAGYVEFGVPLLLLIGDLSLGVPP